MRQSSGWACSADDKKKKKKKKTPFKFEDAPARNAFEYLQMIYIARN